MKPSERINELETKKHYYKPYAEDILSERKLAKAELLGEIWEIIEKSGNPESRYGKFRSVSIIENIKSLAEKEGITI